MKMQQICIVCGSPAFADGLCENCFLERKKLFRVPEKIQLKHCPSCGSYYDNEWKKEPLEEILKGFVSSGNKIAKIGVKIKPGFALFVGSGYIKPSRKMKAEQKKSVLLIEKRKCDNCVKLLSGYYQAIFQIRGPDKDKILGKVLSLVSSDEIIPEEAKNGYNIKFIDKKNAARTARLLKASSIKRTYKLVTEKKGKKLYRDYYSIR